MRRPVWFAQTVTTTHPIYALLAQFRIMDAVGAPLEAWLNFQRELQREHAALQEDAATWASVDREYRAELASVLLAVADRVARLRSD